MVRYLFLIRREAAQATEAVKYFKQTLTEIYSTISNFSDEIQITYKANYCTPGLKDLNLHRRTWMANFVQ